MMTIDELAAPAARRTELVAALWPDGDHPDSMQVYAVLDAARDDRIHPLLLATGLEYTCLFSGPLHPDLRAAAPYLVHLSPTAHLTAQVLVLGVKNSWGIILQTPPEVTLQQLRRHFRGLLQVQSDTGQILLFRFYDPRVLSEYLPTCTRDEAAHFFGPIERLYANPLNSVDLRVFPRRVVQATPTSVGGSIK